MPRSPGSCSPNGTGAFLLGRVYDTGGPQAVPRTPPRVQRFDRDGHVVELDQGNIEPGSLALSRDGRLLYWVKDGVAQRARLPVDASATASTAHTVAEDARGRIFRRGDLLYARLFARRHAVQFDIDGGAFVAPLVASPFAAAASFSASSSGVYEELQVIDMRTGALASHDASRLAGLVLTRHGVAVFLTGQAATDDGYVLDPPRVQRMDRRGRLTPLDAGNLDVHSLALSTDGRFAYWLKDGVAHSARL